MQTEGQADFRELLADRFLAEGEQVMDYELCFYDVQRAASVGLEKEFLLQHVSITCSAVLSLPKRLSPPTLAVRQY